MSESAHRIPPDLREALGSEVTKQAAARVRVKLVRAASGRCHLDA